MKLKEYSANVSIIKGGRFMKTVFAILVLSLSVNTFAGQAKAAKAAPVRNVAAMPEERTPYPIKVEAACNLISKDDVSGYKHSCRGKYASKVYDDAALFCCIVDENY